MVAVSGVDPDGLLAEMERVNDQLFEVRMALAARRAQMAVLESEVSLFDHTRKALLSRIGEDRRLILEAQIVLEVQQDGKATTKVVEAALDTWAHAHPEYIAFLEEAKERRQQYEAEKAKLDETWAKIHHLTGVMEYLTQRIRLAEEQIRFGRDMSKLT